MGKEIDHTRPKNEPTGNEKTHTVTSNGGNVLMSIDTTNVDVHVVTDSLFTTTRVVIRTDDTTGPSAETVRASRITQDGQRVTVTVPAFRGASQTVTTGRSGFVNIVQTFDTIPAGQSVTGMTIDADGNVTRGIKTTTPFSSPVKVLISMPPACSIRFWSRSARLCLAGALAALDGETASGDLFASQGGVGLLSWKTRSGAVCLGALAVEGAIETASSDISIGAYSGHNARLKTSSGDIELAAVSAACGRLDVSTVTGDITLIGARHLKVSARSRTGDIHQS